MKPNAPRMATVLIALALLVAGLGLTVFEVAAVEDRVSDFLRDNELDFSTEEAGFLALLGSNLALLVGSLLKGY